MRPALLRPTLRCRPPISGLWGATRVSILRHSMNSAWRRPGDVGEDFFILLQFYGLAFLNRYDGLLESRLPSRNASAPAFFAGTPKHAHGHYGYAKAARNRAGNAGFIDAIGYRKNILAARGRVARIFRHERRKKRVLRMNRRQGLDGRLRGLRMLVRVLFLGRRRSPFFFFLQNFLPKGHRIISASQARFLEIKYSGIAGQYACSDSELPPHPRTADCAGHAAPPFPFSMLLNSSRPENFLNITAAALVLASGNFTSSITRISRSRALAVSTDHKARRAIFLLIFFSYTFSFWGPCVTPPPFQIGERIEPCRARRSEEHTTEL